MEGGNGKKSSLMGKEVAFTPLASCIFKKALPFRCSDCAKRLPVIDKRMVKNRVWYKKLLWARTLLKTVCKT